MPLLAAGASLGSLLLVVLVSLVFLVVAVVVVSVLLLTLVLCCGDDEVWCWRCCEIPNMYVKAKATYESARCSCG